jgi:hypothetical protein
MKKLMFILLFFHLALFFSQNETGNSTYQIIFNGALTSEQKSSLESTLNRADFVKQSKVRYKPEKNAGEIVLVVSREVRQKGEEIQEFDPTRIKKILSDFQLEIVEFNRKD